MTATALVRGRNARSTPPASPLLLAGGRQHTAETILRAWFESKSPHTIAAYQCDIEEFALFVSRALAISPILKVSEALEWFFQQATASAHETVLHFRSHLEKAGMAPSSINRHLCALRSLTALARMLGVIDWRIELAGVKTERRRDTRGPVRLEFVVRPRLGAGQGLCSGRPNRADSIDILHFFARFSRRLTMFVHRFRKAFVFNAGRSFRRLMDRGRQ